MTYRIGIVSRPIGSLNTSIEIYTYNLLKALHNILTSRYSILGSRIDVVFIPTEKYVIPYGTLLSPIGYDIIGAFFQGFNILNKKVHVLHILHHVNSLALIATREKDYPRKIVTIHHVPEDLDPDYGKIAMKFLRIVLEHIKTDNVTNIVHKIYTSNLGLKSTLFSKHDNSTFNLALKYSDAIVAVSSLTALELKKLFPQELRDKKIFITPLGSIDFDKRIIPVESMMIKNESKKFVIGYVGALSFRKGALLFPILASYIKKYGLTTSIKFKIEMWGQGPLTRMISYMSKKLNVDDILKVMGTFRRQHLPRIYRRFNVQVFPTLKEGFGLPIVEAATLGVPTMVFSYAKIPQEVKSMTIEVEDIEEAAKTLVDLAERRDLLNEAIQRSLEHSYKFTWEKTALLTLKAYLDIVK